MDDEKVAYKGYEKMMQAGIKNVCIHKGLFAPGIEKQYPNLRALPTLRRGTGSQRLAAAQFVIYHSAYRHVGGDPNRRWRNSSAPVGFLDQRSCRHPGAIRRQTMSTATWVSCSRQRWWPSRMSAPH